MAQSGNNQAFGQEYPQQPRMVLSAEERKVLSECSSEAVWYRAVPGAVFGGLLATLAINRGFMSPSPRFGIYPKAVGAATIAFFLGKMSYSRECANKFLTQAPNSEIARQIREGRRRRSGIYDDTSDLDTRHADAMAKSEEFKQPEMFDEAREARAAAGANSSPSVTYDQLREAHRRQDSRRAIPVAPTQPELSRQSEAPSADFVKPPAPDGLSAQTEKPRRRRLNKYGDEILED